MPSFSDLPQVPASWDVQDQNLYNRMPYFFSKYEAQKINFWAVYQQLFGKLPWKPNQGPLMRMVQPTPSPKIRQNFTPVAISSDYKIDRFSTGERTEDAILKWHKFETPRFSFLPPFQDFITNRLKLNHDDLLEQITYAQETFCFTFLFQKARFAYICDQQDATVASMITPPYLTKTQDVSDANITLNGKNAAWLANVATKNMGKKGLTIRALDAASLGAINDIGMDFFDGPVGRPKENSPLTGKFALIGSAEAFEQLKYDPDFSSFRNITVDVMKDGWEGSLFKRFAWRSVKYPPRFLDDGTWPNPEMVDEDGYIVPNPSYVNAPNEVALMLGAAAAKIIPVGPPPSEFAGQNISQQKFVNMRWNGEVKLTDNFLLKDSNGEYRTNNDGLYVKLEALCTYGALINNPRQIVAVMYRRNRVTDRL